MRTRDIATPDGRTLHVAEDGYPGGTPVVFQPGTPGGVEPLYGPIVQDAHERGIWLIAYDRPGYGTSTPQPGRTIADAAADVAAVADALGIDLFATWGISGGAPHVLATAALLPERVIAAAVLASPAPYDADGLDWYAGQGEDNVNEHQTAARGREPLVELLDPPRRAMLAAVPDDMAREMRSLLSDVDAKVMTGDRAAYLLAASQKGLEHGVDGWVDDDRAFVTPWGFDPSDINVPALLLHGEHDRFIPPAHGRWLAERIPGVHAEISADDGHLSLLTHRFRDVHEWLLGH